MGRTDPCDSRLATATNLGKERIGLPPDAGRRGSGKASGGCSRECKIDLPAWPLDLDNGRSDSMQFTVDDGVKALDMRIPLRRLRMDCLLRDAPLQLHEYFLAIRSVTGLDADDWITAPSQAFRPARSTRRWR